MAKLTPEKAADNELGFFIKWLNPPKGKPPFSKQEIATRYYKLSGKRITRQTVERWLKPKAKDRIPPLFGNGLVLRETLASLHHEFRDREMQQAMSSTVTPNTPAKPVKTRKASTRGKSVKPRKS